MTTSIASELRNAFELASMRKAAEALKTPEHWAEANEIRNRSQKLRDTEERLYRETYDTRVEAARSRIIDEAGERTRTFAPGWAGADRFDAADTLRQAQREVRNAHEQDQGRIAATELTALTALVDRSGQENTGPKTTGFAEPPGPDQGPQRTGPEQ